MKIVHTLLILAIVIHAAPVQPVHDVGQVKQVIALLNDISTKLASEREQENTVYDEVKRYCHLQQEEPPTVSEDATASSTDVSSTASVPVSAASTSSDTAESSDEAGKSASADDDTSNGSDASDASAESTSEAPASGEASSDVDTSTESGESDLAKPPEGRKESVMGKQAQQHKQQTKVQGADGVESDDTPVDTDRTNALLDAAKGKAVASPPSPKATQKQLRKAKPSRDEPEHQKATKEVRPAVNVHKHRKSSATSKHLEDDDSAVKSASVDELASLVKDVLPSDDQLAMSTEPAESGAAITAEPGSAAVATKVTPQNSKVALKHRRKVKPAHHQEHEHHLHQHVPTKAKKAHSSLPKHKRPNVQVSKPSSKQKAEEDSASVEQLASVVKAAIAPEDQAASSPKPVVAETELKAGSGAQENSTVSGYEPLASDVLSIDGFTAPAEATAQPPKQMVIKPVPERPQEKRVAEAVQSEFDQAANEVDSLETDWGAKQQQQDDASVAQMSSAFNDLGGAIPRLDQQALQLYNSFGGEPASIDTLGGLSSSPSFLQVSKHRHILKLFHLANHQTHATKSAPTLRADVDAAWNTLKAVAEETKSAMSLMDLVRKDAGAKDAGVAPGESSTASPGAQNQCAMVMKKLEQRRKARAKSEADLEQRSQQLLKSLTADYGQKAKNLRSRR